MDEERNEKKEKRRKIFDIVINVVALILVGVALLLYFLR